MVLGALLGGWALVVGALAWWSVRRCRKNRTARARELDRQADLR
jgi:hypothetical protein